MKSLALALALPCSIEQIDEPAASAMAEAGAWSYDYWENLPAAEYARRQGVQPVNDFSVLFGASQAEDWEGFKAFGESRQMRRHHSSLKKT